MLTLINSAPIPKLHMSSAIQRIYALRNLATTKTTLFAGHSKWANIRHTKAAKDAQKSALFKKYSRQIRLAIQDGGSADISLNSQLKSVVEEAIRRNMPMTTIQNNIQKYKQNNVELKRCILYMRFKQKVFIVCVLYTENLAAVKMELATLLRKSGASLLDTNHLFHEIGIVQAVIDKSRIQLGSRLEDIATEDAIMFGAEEVDVLDTDNGIVNFFCKPLKLNSLRKIIEASGYVIDSADQLFVPLNVVDMSKEELLEYQKFVAKLKDISGVEEIYDNTDAV